MDAKFLVLAIIIAVLITSQVIPNPINLFSSTEVTIIDPTVLLVTAGYIGNLPILNMDDVYSAEQYHDFADKTNDASKILNDKLHFQTPILAGTQAEYSAISTVIAKYVLPIGSYNDMIDSAQVFVDTYNNQHVVNPSLMNDFLEKVGVFTFQIALIAASPYSSVSYDLVGTLYRSTGIQAIAFKCPDCVSVILSNAYSFVNTSFIGASTSTFDNALNIINRAYVIPQKIGN